MRTILCSRWTGSIAVATIYALLMWNCFVPTLRLYDTTANSIAFALAQALPLLLVALVDRRGSRLMRWLAYTLLAPIVAQAALWAALAILDLQGFERLHTVPVSGRRLSVYLTNGGATTSFGIVIRQECDLLPGVMLVRKVFDAYPADDATIEQIGTYHVRVHIPAYSDRAPARVEELELPGMPCVM